MTVVSKSPTQFCLSLLFSHSLASVLHHPPLQWRQTTWRPLSLLRQQISPKQRVKGGLALQASCAPCAGSWYCSTEPQTHMRMWRKVGGLTPFSNYTVYTHSLRSRGKKEHTTSLGENEMLYMNNNCFHTWN